MARTQILHGAWVDIPTADEIVKLLPRPIRHTRMRTAESVELDNNGAALIPFTVYKVPAGMEFALRRVTFDLGNVNGPTLVASSISLGTPGNFIEYLRSGQHLGWALPLSPAGTNGRCPGTETWGDQQGPYLRNGEQFQIAAALAAASANVSLTVTIEGILTENRPDA